MSDLSFGDQSVLHILESQAAAQRESAKILDDKALQTISLGSLIVTIIGAFGIEWSGTEVSFGPEAERFYLAIFVGYGFAFVYSALSRIPIALGTYPIKTFMSQKQYRCEIDKWTKYDKRTHLSKLINSYADIIQYNERRLRLKYILTTSGVLTIGIIMILTALFVFNSLQSSAVR